jgi:hypothetical protein
MWLRPWVTAAIVTLAIGGVSAQTGTVDGVAALARGDYQRAVEILKPIADDWRANDTAAQFFMAGLYETGRGVPVDPLRACALYMRASSNHDSVFGREASLLFGKAIGRGNEFNEECQLLANTGFDNGFEPVTFHLGPGHAVEWTLAAATVTYDGRTKREQTGLMFPGARFLPLQHTELSTGPTRSLTRHFIEMFVWVPSTRSGAPWKLHWLLFEIVRDEIVRLEFEDSLLSVDGAPPSRAALDVREYVVVRVDDEGNAEWAMLKGPHPRTQRIESDAERREIRDEALARDKALEGVDWKRRHDPNRQPAMAYVDADGCGSIEVYGWSADRAEAVLVRSAGGALGVSAERAAFDLSRDAANISVKVYVYATARRQFHFCSDVRPVPDSMGPETWRAVAGTVTIELSPPGIRARARHRRRATVILSNVVLRSPTGTIVTVPGPITLRAVVGGIAG